MRSSPISLPSAKEWTCACVVVTDRRMLAASAATAAAAAKSASVLNNCLPSASFPSIPFYFSRLLDRHFHPASQDRIPYIPMPPRRTLISRSLIAPFSCIILSSRHTSPIDYLEECAKIQLHA